MFPFPIIPSVGNPLINVDAADFDGTNDYATRGAGLTGISDSKIFTFTSWVIRDTSTTSKLFASTTALGGSSSRFALGKNVTTNTFSILGRNSASSTILDATSTNGIPASQWVWVGISVDLSDTNKRHLYFNDTSELSVVTYTNDTIDFTDADWCFGAFGDGTQKWNGGFAETMFWPGAYIDFSQESNRRKFISGSGKPVNPAAIGGAIDTLGTPIVYFHLDDGETANNFVANNDRGATGGAFTVTGTLSTYTTSPSD